MPFQSPESKFGHLCISCAKCCYLPNNIPCKYLSLTGKCQIYNNRLGVEIGTVQGITYYCNLVENAAQIKGCTVQEAISSELKTNIILKQS